jgi:hypothetical protein
MQREFYFLTQKTIYIMTNTLQISQLTEHLSTDNMYNFLLGITSDGLYILNLDKTLLLEVIVNGNSNDCMVCSTPDEDTFLDAILFIKKVLKDGYNPLEVIKFY